jgi:hypothetical protein
MMKDIVESDIHKVCSNVNYINDCALINSCVIVYCMLTTNHPGHHYWFNKKTGTQISWPNLDKK